MSKVRSTPATLILSGPVAFGSAWFFAVAIAWCTLSCYTSSCYWKPMAETRREEADAPVPEPCSGAAGAESLDVCRRCGCRAGGRLRRRRSGNDRGCGHSVPVRRRLARAAPHAKPAPGRSRRGGRRRQAGRPVGAEPCGRRQRSADHLRCGRHCRPCQRRGAVGLRRHCAGPLAADEVPCAGDAVGDRARAHGPRRLRGGRLCRARADRARLQGHGLADRPRHRAVRRGVQGPERGAPHRPHAGRLHRQCQP